MLRIVHISDTHNCHQNVAVPDGDMVVHTGDFTNYGLEYEVDQFFKWWNSLYHPFKILVPGNHDMCADVTRSHTGKIEPWYEKILNNYTNKLPYLNHYLLHKSCKIWGINFFGSPYIPSSKEKVYHRFGFTKNRSEVGSQWSDIPKDTDILVTHGGPFGRQDFAMTPMYGGPAGCERLRFQVEVVRPKLHLFGHIHEAHGTCFDDHTTYSNASMIDSGYNIVNRAKVFDFDEVTKEVTIIQ